MGNRRANTIAVLIGAMALAGAAPSLAQTARRPAAARPAPPRPVGPSATATAERPILLIAQLRAGAVDRSLLPQFEPLHTLHDIEGVLRAHNIPFGRGRAQLDTRNADPRLVATISQLPPHEIFVVPQGDGYTFNQVLRALTPREAEFVENW